MAIYEYKEVTTKLNIKDHSKVINFLNKQGEKGWQVVNTVTSIDFDKHITYYVFLLMREKEG